MKNLFLLTIIFVICSMMSTPSYANSMSLRICEYAQANDKSRLRSFLKENKLKIRSIFDSIECNGDNLLIFSAKSNALEVGEFIIGKLPAKKVKPQIEELAKHSAHLAEEAKER